MIGVKEAEWRIIAQNREDDMAWLQDAYTRIIDQWGRCGLETEKQQDRVLNRIERCWTSMQRGPRFPTVQFRCKKLINHKKVRSDIEEWRRQAHRLANDQKKSQEERDRLEDAACTYEIILDGLTDPALQWYVCVNHEDDLLSLACVKLSDGNLQLGILATNPDGFGRGAGQALLGYVETLAKEASVSVCSLSSAVLFYSARGYYLDVGEYLAGNGSTMVRPAPGRPLFSADQRSQLPQ